MELIPTELVAFKGGTMKKFLCISLMLFTFTVSGQELMLVWSKKVDLYNEQGQIKRILTNGQLVQVQNYVKDNTRYLISLNGVNYNAKKMHFKNPADVVTVYKKTILEYEAQIKKDDLRLSEIESNLIMKYVIALELRRDTALAYEKITGGFNNGQAYRGFVQMLSEGKYKKLMKAWSKEVEELLEEKSGLQASKRKYFVAMEELKYKIGDFENLGEMLVEKQTKGDMYYVIKDGAQVYLNNKIVKQVNKGVSLLARPHPTFGGWSEVIIDDKKYTMSSKSLVKKSDYSKYLKEKMITSKVLVEQLNSEVEIQQFRLKLYQGVSSQLEADRFLQGGYGVVKNLIVPIDNDRTFTINSPSADRVFVNSNRANKVLNEWKEEALNLTQGSLRNQKTVLALKKQLIDLQNDLNNFK